MMQTSDDRFAALRALGHSGSLEDMLLKYYHSLGETTGTIVDRAMSWFAKRGYTGSYQDRLYQYTRLYGGYPEVIAGAVAQMFLASEQGVWYDPSDFSTMFQDSAGTTPVTAVEQPVGLILDKRLGLVLGSELGSNPGNPFTVTTGFVGTAPGITTVSVVAGNLRTSVDTAYGRTTYAVSGLVVGKTYKIVINALASAGDWYVDTTGGFTGGSQQSSLARTITLYKTATATTANILLIGIAVSPFDISGISLKLLDGNHASQATSTKRPLLKQDATGHYSLLFDGVDDALATAAIDFTATDKMTVWAGVRKLSDAAIGIIAELSVNAGGATGSFQIRGPSSVASNYLFSSGGSLVNSAVLVPTGYAAPITNVLACISDIVGDSAVIRINGIQAASSSADQGTGNFRSDVLYIGSRAGTSLPFNGHLYSLIIRGAASTAAQITSGETYANSKAGAF